MSKLTRHRSVQLDRSVQRRKNARL